MDLFNLGTGRPPELFAERSLTLIYTLIHFHDEPFSRSISLFLVLSRSLVSLDGSSRRMRPRIYTRVSGTRVQRGAALLIRVLKDWPWVSGRPDR